MISCWCKANYESKHGCLLSRFAVYSSKNRQDVSGMNTTSIVIAGDSKHLWQSVKCLAVYTTQHPRRQPSSYWSLCEPQIWRMRYESARLHTKSLRNVHLSLSFRKGKDTLTAIRKPDLNIYTRSMFGPLLYHIYLIFLLLFGFGLVMFHKLRMLWEQGDDKLCTLHGGYNRAEENFTLRRSQFVLFINDSVLKPRTIKWAGRITWMEG
jgi:hypothetical protein